MKLSKALGVTGAESVAFVGAGGKTQAIFNLAKEISSTVVITTTTHFGAWQANLANEHIIVKKQQDMDSLKFESNKVFFLTGPCGDDERLSGLDQVTITALNVLCKKKHIPLLIEADGARQLSIKAPADYEPVIPNWVDKVVVMAGLSVIGKTLSEAYVHRPGHFSDITGLAMGDTIKVEDLIRLLSSNKGGLKDVPTHVKRYLFLNQAEGLLLKAKGKRLADALLPYYDRALVGSLQESAENAPVFSVHTQTGGVILAAGGSERFGSAKQFLDWDGKPFIVQVVETALDAGLKPIIVITGEDHDAIKALLQDYDVEVSYNPNWEEGQSTSMKLGLASLPERCENIVFLLSDQPQISPLLIRSLIERQSLSLSPIVAPIAGGRRANPVLFNQVTFAALEQVTGDRGGRAIFNQFNVDWLPWSDARIQMDVDSQGDEQRLREAYFGKQANQ